MVFSSILFLFYFLPIIFLLYFISPEKHRNTILFIASLCFYAWGEPIYILLMLFSTISDFWHGQQIYKNIDNIKSKIYLISSVIINLGLLGFFKYSDFIINNLNHLFNTNIETLNLALPIGISFYTFQTMSYSIDIYMKKAKPQQKIIDFGLYVTLFPQLIAGPIVRYNEIAKELTNRKTNIIDGLERFIIGLAKKVLLANQIGVIWEHLQNTPNSYFSAWLGIIAFAFQIYFDFSGYSDMAIGLGKCFGFNFSDNFNYPYTSKSITDFWRRWHISLSTWFKEYVYIPLGGNKVGLKKQIRNILIVWLLTGVWHGANWNFILWGVYFGVLLLLEKFILMKLLNKIPTFIQHLYSMILVLIGWTIFAIEDTTKLYNYLIHLFINNQLFDQASLFELSNNVILLILCCLCATPIVKKIYNKYNNYVLKNITLIALFLITLNFLIASTYNPFLYFRF